MEKLMESKINKTIKRSSLPSLPPPLSLPSLPPLPSPSLSSLHSPSFSLSSSFHSLFLLPPPPVTIATNHCERQTVGCTCQSWRPK